jgi:hypothetical protein
MVMMGFGGGIFMLVNVRWSGWAPPVQCVVESQLDRGLAEVAGLGANEAIPALHR